ncbi:MAG: hypothetical protein DCF31_06975 [Alphaproteobacteria bacterium]|nr:MAG: hypothetical protein DCF31_06975 [Alphaproteobacteria bacterium]
MKRVAASGLAAATLLVAVSAVASLPTLAPKPPPALALDLPAPPAPVRPRRVASLNLCTDELALLLAAPGQLVSISRLGAEPRETPVATRARGLARNRGRVTDIVALQPDLVLTSAGDASAATAARRLGFAVVNVVQPRSLAEVSANIRQVARALDRAAAGEALIARMLADLGPRPSAPVPALIIGGGGQTIAADGLSAQWLRHAGLQQQRVTRGQVDLERLLSDPPQVLVISRYYPGQMSANQNWLAHPAIAALPAAVQRIETDGRVWTCGGPLVAAEVARLRALVRR